VETQELVQNLANPVPARKPDQEPRKRQAGKPATSPNSNSTATVRPQPLQRWNRHRQNAFAIAIARQTIRSGRKARFLNMLDLVNQLEREKLDNRSGRLVEQLARQDLAVPDEHGYLPFSKSGGTSSSFTFQALRADFTDHH
jgi:hypothetical protein